MKAIRMPLGDVEQIEPYPDGSIQLINLCALDRRLAKARAATFVICQGDDRGGGCLVILDRYDQARILANELQRTG